MNNIVERFVTWLHDPFNRTDLRKHDNIVQELYVTTERSAERSQRLARYARFPLSAQTGNPQHREVNSYAKR